MYELFKIISVIAIILWALRDKIDEPRNVKYCCNKANETKVKSSSIESFTVDAPSDDDTPAARPFIVYETPVIDMPAAESIVESFTFDVPNDDTPAPQPFVVYETPVIELSIVELSTVELSTVDMPAAESTVDMPAAESTTVDMPAAESTIDDMPVAESTDDMPAAESTINDDEPEEDILSIDDLYGDYTDLLMPSIMLRLSNNTSVNNTFVPRNNCFGVVHASI
uniref:Uncharacterized protein n=1 Tax=viral metagenome TaxID=1070528 RepID=A0A6C0B7X2_9ZZZZ